MPWKKAAQGVMWAMLAVGGVMGAALIKPTAPIHSPLWDVATKLSDNFVEMVGWPDMAEQVAAIYAGLPETDKPHTAILAGNYGEAGALAVYGPNYHLPPVISGANSLWERGYGNPAPETVIVVGFERGYADKFFQSCQYAGTMTNRDSVKNEETSRHTGLYVCHDPRQPWDMLWKDMQWFE